MPKKMPDGPKEEGAESARLIDQRGDGGRKIVVLNAAEAKKKGSGSPPG